MEPKHHLSPLHFTGKTILGMPYSSFQNPSGLICKIFKWLVNYAPRACVFPPFSLRLLLAHSRQAAWAENQQNLHLPSCTCRRVFRLPIYANYLLKCKSRTAIIALSARGFASFPSNYQKHLGKDQSQQLITWLLVPTKIGSYFRQKTIRVASDSFVSSRF